MTEFSVTIPDPGPGPGAAAMVRVLVADADPRQRDLLAERLGRRWIAAIKADSASMARAAVIGLCPSIAIVDPYLPILGHAGLSAPARYGLVSVLRQASPDLTVIAAVGPGCTPEESRRLNDLGVYQIRDRGDLDGLVSEVESFLGRHIPR